MIITTTDPSELALLQVTTPEPKEKERPIIKKKKKSTKKSKAKKSKKGSETSKKSSSTTTSSKKKSRSKKSTSGTKKRPKKSKSEISDTTEETVSLSSNDFDVDDDELSITSITTDATNSSTDTSSRKKKVVSFGDIQIREFEPVKRVTFGNVQIREYERIAGIHPDTRIGVALSIGWRYYDVQASGEDEGSDSDSDDNVITIDEYETNMRKSGEVIKKCPRIDSTRRRHILQSEFKVSDKDIDNAMKVSRQVRKQRIQSNRQDETTAKFESALLVLSNKVKYHTATKPLSFLQTKSQRQHNKTLMQYNKRLKAEATVTAETN